MSDLLALAERCEAATGPDRELDVAIALACGIVRERDGNCLYGHRDFSVMVLERGYYDHDGHAPELPAYTASLDAAMTLVPEGWVLDRGTLFWPGQVAKAYLVETKPDADGTRWFGAGCAQVNAANDTSLALALTAAALRARVASTPSLNAEIAGMGEGM